MEIYEHFIEFYKIIQLRLTVFFEDEIAQKHQRFLFSL